MSWNTFCELTIYTSCTSPEHCQKHHLDPEKFFRYEELFINVFHLIFGIFTVFILIFGGIYCILTMSTHWGVDILFLLFPASAVQRHTWFPDILGNSSYPIFTKFGMQVYWVNSLYGNAFGDDSSIAN